MIYPIQEVPLDMVQRIKDATKRKLLEKATNNWQKPVTDYVIREIVMGDATCPDMYDIQPDTVVTAATPSWMMNDADLTANSLSAITSTGKEVDDGKWLGFYGYADISGEAGALGGTVVSNVYEKLPPHGDVTAVQFKRGSSVLDAWFVEQLYSYDEVVGISDTPVIYEESEAYIIEANAMQAGEDKHIVLRGYTCESIGLGHFNPTMSRNVDARSEHGVTSISNLSQEQQIQAVMRGGMDPVQEMTPEQIMRLYDRAKAGLYSMIVENGSAKSVQEARRNYYVRPLCGGDSDGTQADTYTDVNIEPVSGQMSDEEFWWQDADNVSTVGALLKMIKTGTTIDDNKYVAVIGISDRGPMSTLLSVAPGDQGGNLDFSDVQHLYAYHDAVKGYTHRITYYKPGAPFGYKMAFSAARDNHVVPLALIAEPYGHVASAK